MLIPAIIAAVTSLAGAAAGCVLLGQAVLRRMVGGEYSIRIPPSVEVRRNRTGLTTGRFRMGYPAWASAKTSRPRVVHHPTVIIIGGWRLSAADPFEAYGLVTAMRDAGHELALCPEEQRKLNSLTERARWRASATGVARIMETFRDHPADFRVFCADLFHTLGWRVRPADHGTGLDLVRPDGAAYVAACEFRPRVDRAPIQRLREASSAARARGMMVVTVGRYSRAAAEYAERAGIELVDGDGLMELCRRAWGLIPSPSVPDGAARLTRGDIMSRIPAGLRGRYRNENL